MKLFTDLLSLVSILCICVFSDSCLIGQSASDHCLFCFCVLIFLNFEFLFIFLFFSHPYVTFSTPIYCLLIHVSFWAAKMCFRYFRFPCSHGDRACFRLNIAWGVVLCIMFCSNHRSRVHRFWARGMRQTHRSFSLQCNKTFIVFFIVDFLNYFFLKFASSLI